MKYNRARAAILTPQGQAAHTAFVAGYDQRPDVIANRIAQRHDDQARDTQIVCEAVQRFASEHPILAARHGIDLNGTWSEIAGALYDCYIQSARTVGVLRNGHGSFHTDIDPYNLQRAWMAAARLAV